MQDFLTKLTRAEENPGETLCLRSIAEPCVCSALAALLLARGAAARAQRRLSVAPDPSRRRLPPGSAADVTARVLANGMSPRLGQQIVVENKPGAGSQHRGRLRRACREGRLHPLPRLVRQHHQSGDQPHLTFDMVRDFAPIALVTAIAAVVLVVNPALEVKCVPELIALAEVEAGRGCSTLRPASAPRRTSPPSCSRMRIGVKLVHVPYQGSPQAVTDLIAGRTTMMFSPASTVMPQIEAGKLTRARDRRFQAAEHPARPAHHGGGRDARFRHQHLVRPDGAQRHAASA